MYHYKFSPDGAKYKNARLSLLILLILSTLNLIMILTDSYFLFSAQLPLFFAQVGLLLKAETGLSIYFIMGMVLGFICLVPYLLCWIFSKKRVGWLIAGLVLFSIDTILLIIDLISYIAMGDFSLVIDFVAHSIIIYELAVSLSNRFASNSIIVEEGFSSACYEVKVKSGLSSAKIEITLQ